MLTNTMKWVALIAPLAAILSWTSARSFAFVLQFTICGSLSLVALQAFESGKRFWTIALAGAE